MHPIYHLSSPSDFTSTMSSNGSSETACRSEVRPSNTTCSQKELAVTASAISMTVGIFSNSLALFILVKSYNRIGIKSKASFLLFASSLVVTDLLGHVINGTLVLFVYSFHKKWETFDPHSIVCSIFGACMVFFGLSPLFLGSAMAVERCIGVTRPIFHSTTLASHHMKRLLGLIWLLAALVAVLPVLLWRPYRVQSSKSWCFFQMEDPKDWLDVLLPLLFSMLGLLALLLSIVCNALTSCALLQARLRRKHHCRGTSYHIEMICQLLAIMLVSCVCWGPLLVRASLQVDPELFRVAHICRNLEGKFNIFKTFFKNLITTLSSNQLLRLCIRDIVGKKNNQKQKQNQKKLTIFDI